MRKNCIEKLVIYLLVFYMLVGCTGGGTISSPQKTKSIPYSTQTVMPLSTIRPTIKLTSIPTNIIGKTPTVAQEQKLGPKLFSLPLPDLLLSVNRASRYECVTQGSEEIWLASYPYSKPRLLLFSTEVDYRFPTWSPDGKWIAYVESRAEIIPEEKMGDQKAISGTDTVWIIRPDGSEKRKISVEIPSALFSHIMGINVVCDVMTEIDSPLKWSPDGKYLVFMRAWMSGNMKWNYSYYLTEVSTGKSHTLFTQSRKASILWGNQSNRILIQADTEEFNQINIQGTDKVEVKQKKFVLPDETKNNISYKFLPSEREDLLYGVFEFKNEKNPTNTPEVAMIWNYDLGTNQWNKITEIPVTTWYRTTILENQIIRCDEKSRAIQLLDPETWQTFGELHLPIKLYFQCVSQDFKELNDPSGREWIIFEGTVGGSQKGLWAILLQAGIETNPELIVDYSTMSGKMNGLSAFSFTSQ